MKEAGGAGSTMASGVVTNEGTRAYATVREGGPHNRYVQPNAQRF